MIKFIQEFMYDFMVIDVNVMGLQFLVGGYYIYEWLVLQKFFKIEIVCDGLYVVGYFNLNNVVVFGFLSVGIGIVDQYEIGDISGKFGLLNGKLELMEMYIDYNFLLFGVNSVIG